MLETLTNGERNLFLYFLAICEKNDSTILPRPLYVKKLIDIQRIAGMQTKAFTANQILISAFLLRYTWSFRAILPLELCILGFFNFVVSGAKSGTNAPGKYAATFAQRVGLLETESAAADK